MTIIKPLAISDARHAMANLRLMKRFGPYLEDRILILPTPDAMTDHELRPVIEGLKELFTVENTAVIQTPNSFGGNWSYNSASHFKFAMETVDNMGWDDQPCMWMEADLYPLVPNWLQLIKDDYQLAATPFRGMIERSRFEDTNPVTKEVTPRFEGRHLVGAGIYPMGYLRYRCPVGGSPMASYKNPSISIPFDVKCQDQHLPATQSPLWLHKPRTVNWSRVEGDNWTCEDQSVDRFGLTYAGSCSLKGIALLHGPKDSSLADEILKKETFIHSPPPAQSVPRVDSCPPTEAQHAPDAPVPLASTPDTPDTRNEQLLERIADLETDLSLQVEQNAVLYKENIRLSQLIESTTQETAPEIRGPELVQPIQGKKKAARPATVKKKLGRPKKSAKAA